MSSIWDSLQNGWFCPQLIQDCAICHGHTMYGFVANDTIYSFSNNSTDRLRSLELVEAVFTSQKQSETAAVRMRFALRAILTIGECNYVRVSIQYIRTVTVHTV